MYARLATYRRPEGAPELTDTDHEQFITLLTSQDGCRAAFEVAEDGEGAAEALFISLWDTREQAEAAGDKTRQATMPILERHGITDLAPPEVRVLEVVASSV